MLPVLARGTGALAWPPAAPQPVSLQRSWHLSQGSLASRSCSWSPRAPWASIRGPARRRGSRSSDDTTQFPIDGGCFLLAPLWLWGGCASIALTWTRRGAGLLPLGCDCETVQGGDQTPDPQRLDSTPRVSPAPASRSLGPVEGHRAVSPGRVFFYGALSAEATGRTVSQHGCFPVFPTLSPLGVRVIPNHGKH